MVIQHNLAAMNSNRQLGVTTGLQAKSSEKLSSGYRINRAADDAAGLAISEKMRRQIRGLTQAEDNVQDGISYVQVADGALAEIDDMLARMTELCVKAATETLTDSDRQYIDQEIQQLKLECNKTFHTTSFNEKLIWDENTVERKPIGTEWRPLMSWGSTGSGKTEITEVNKGAWPPDGFKFNVSGDGSSVKLTWKGYDGVQYETSDIEIPDIETLKSEGFTLPVNSSTVDYDKYPSAVGIEPAIKMNIDEDATREQFITMLSSRTIGTGLSYSLSPTLKMDPSYVPSQYVSVSARGNMNYLAGLVSGKSVTASPDRDHISTDPDTGINRTNAETFDYILTKDEDTLPAGDTFGATVKYEGYPSSVYVTSGDRRPETQGVWWDYYTNSRQTHSIGYSFGQSNIADSLDSLLNTTGSNNILTNSNAASNIRIDFDFKADSSQQYSYQNEDGSRTQGSSTNNLGDVYLEITVRPGATADDVKNAVNAIRGMEIASNRGARMGLSYPSSYYYGPIYGGTMALDIQAGANSTTDDVIPIIYDVLNNHSLKINDLDTLTSEHASAGLEKIQNAARVVDEQRAIFGAYQNRMEHAYKNLGNVVENTQSAESIIRDTDMAKEMVKYSNNNILAQAGQSMLAQANQTNQGVLSLIQ